MDTGLSSGSEGSVIAELEHFKSFAAERFRTQVEAASFLGGPAGLDALLGFDEFARALRISGYRRPAERLFQQIANDGMVSVGEMLQNVAMVGAAASRAADDLIAAEAAIAADLSRPEALARATVQERLSSGERASLAPLEVAGAIRAENQLRQELADVTKELRDLRRVVNDAASRDALMDERSGRETNEGEMRQHCVKLEESLARETVALRADNADLRASLTEVLRVAAEERKERQNDVQEVSRRIKDQSHHVDERIQRVEGATKHVQTQANDNRTALQEIEQLREMSEFRVLGAISEEARNRDASIQREQQAREVMCAELEARWKTLLNEERLLRTRENDQLTLGLTKVEDMLRAEREATQAMKAEFAHQVEDLMRKLHDEARLRQSEFTQLVVQAEEARTALQSEVRERRDNEEVTQKKILAVEAVVAQNYDTTEQEFALLKQTVLDLREAGQIEATAREEAVNKLRNLLDDEARAREEAVANEVSNREGGENRIENHWRILMSEERTCREEIETQLEASIVTLQHEFNFEKSKVAAQARELSQSQTQVREGLTAETAARRHEIGQLTKGLEDMCSSLVDEQAARESSESKLREQVGEVAITLRGETVVREEAERRANSERVELQTALQREAGTREEVEARLMQRIADERRLREEAVEAECKIREDADAKIAAQAQKLNNDERKTREAAQRALEHRCFSNEEALGVYKNDRAEHDREVTARFSELEDGLNEARRLARETLLRREELVAVKDLLLSEKAERQAEDSALELAVKEQGVRMEQLTQTQELGERRLDKRCLELAEKVDTEAKERIAGDAEGDRNLADERTDRVNSQVAERRTIQEMIAKVEEAFGKAVLEERRGREEGDSSLDAKCLQLREAIDEARRWQVQATKEALQKEAHERRTDQEKLAASQTETEERIARTEQARIRSEGQLHQENLELKASLKRESRDRELADAKLSTLVREEAQKREDALQREGRLRSEAIERSSESFHNSILQERKARERDDLRLENRSLVNVGDRRAPALDSSMAVETNETSLAANAAEQRAMSRRISEVEDRLQQNEVRQKSAEERTVGMLDAIMTGLQTASD